MSDLPRIAMLWVEGRLSFLERLCAQSFLDRGHAVDFYHYGPVEGVPEGCRLVHGREILDRTRFLADAKTGSVAPFSDVFRYHLLAARDGVVWADTDAYCHRPFRPASGYYFGWQSRRAIATGVLAMPAGSPALADLVEMTRDEYAIPFWLGADKAAEMRARRDAGDPVHVSRMPWATWGPKAATAFLKRSGEADHGLAPESLYPVPYRKRRLMARSGTRRRAVRTMTSSTVSIHFYGRRMREHLANKYGGLPAEGSLLDVLCRRHGIDAEAAPVTRKPAPEAAAPEAAAA